MNWANTMASNADDVANNRVPNDDGTQRNVGSGSWDPHQVWLTRVKQPRDGRHLPASPSPVKLSSRSIEAHFWTSATG